MNKKIITIAEIVFALVFVVLLAVFMATINSKGNTANTQLVDTLEMTSGASIEKYVNLHGKECKGTEVINAATNYKILGGDTKIEIVVVTDNGNTEKHYGYLVLSDSLTATKSQKDSTTVAGLKKGDEIGAYSTPSTSAKDYINPAGDFTVECQKGANDLYDHIKFTQKK